MNKIAIIFISFFSLLFVIVDAKPTVDEFHIFTVASQKTIGLSRLLDSCKHFDIEIDVLGLGLPYEKNTQKLVYVQEYLDTIPDDHVVLFVDGYDTIIVETKEKILAKFLAKNINCVFSASTILYPPKESLRSKFPSSPTRFKYLNSGSYIGYAGYIKAMLKSMQPFDLSKRSDQGLFQLYYLKHKQEIRLDYDCDLFLCSLTALKKEDLRLNPAKKSVHYLGTNKHPCVVHGNGKFGKELYRYICYKLFPECARGEENDPIQKQEETEAKEIIENKRDID